MEPLQYYVIIFFACWIAFAAYMSKIHIYNYLFSQKTDIEETDRKLRHTESKNIGEKLEELLEKK